MEVHLHRYSRFHGCSLFIAIDPETSPKLFHPLTHPADANTVPSVSCLHSQEKSICPLSHAHQHRVLSMRSPVDWLNTCLSLRLYTVTLPGQSGTPRVIQDAI